MSWSSDGWFSDMVLPSRPCRVGEAFSSTHFRPQSDRHYRQWYKLELVKDAGWLRELGGAVGVEPVGVEAVDHPVTGDPGERPVGGDGQVVAVAVRPAHA